MSKKIAQLGSVSWGTMRLEDLVPSFLDKLEELDPETYEEITSAFSDTLERFEDAMDGEQYLEEALDEDDISDLHWLLEHLTDALQECAPLYAYFGSNEGDGADYGFWPDIRCLEENIEDGNVLQVEDEQDISEDISEYEAVAVKGGDGLYALYDSDGNLQWDIR